jgi:hypothetical protein
MARKRKGIPGLSWSWKRATGLSAAKGKVSRALGVPLSRQGRQRKFGKAAGCLIPVALIVAAGTAGGVVLAWAGS